MSKTSTRESGGRGSKNKDAAERTEDASYDLRILRSLRKIMRAVDIYSKKLVTTYGISTPQLICLLAVRDMGPMTSTAIANEMLISPSTLVGILDRLETKGLVMRQRATHDRRLVYITATERGREVAHMAPSPLQDRLLEGLAGLEGGESMTISRSLEKIVELMEAKEISAAPLLDAKGVLETGD